MLKQWAEHLDVSVNIFVYFPLCIFSHIYMIYLDIMIRQSKSGDLQCRNKFHIYNLQLNWFVDLRVLEWYMDGPKQKWTMYSFLQFYSWKWSFWSVVFAIVGIFRHSYGKLSLKFILSFHIWNTHLYKISPKLPFGGGHLKLLRCNFLWNMDKVWIWPKWEIWPIGHHF